MTTQLTLQMRLRGQAEFTNYIVGANAQAVDAVQGCAAGVGAPYVFIWGASGVGRTHLLQAACKQATACYRTGIYLPMAEVLNTPPALLAGMEQLDLVCVDDIQVIAGNCPWEEALFHLYNHLHQAGTHLLVTADRSPTRLQLDLPDLRSRLASGLVFQLQGLNDEAISEALVLHARARGLILPPEVGRFLINRCPRDMKVLFGLLEELDTASLAEQRRLTIPFVKQVLKHLSH
jgi:DnaA family protein